MNKQSVLSCLISAALALPGFVSTTNAAVIDFDGLGLNSEDPVTVDGYTFDYIDRDGWAIGNPADGISNEVGNGTDFITCRDTRDGDCTIRMTRDGGVQFSLTSFDGADGLFNVGGRTIEVTGTLAGGATVTDTFSTVASTFTTFSLSSSFTNLVSADFRGYGPGDDMIAFDNINATAVPLPAPVWLLGTGLLGLIGIARRKRA